VAITDSANASSTGKIFTIFFFNHFSPLALTPYLPAAEETMVDQTVGSSSPLHDSVLVSPRIQPASPQLEVSASPRNHPVSPQPAVQEPSIELEKPPFQEKTMSSPSYSFAVDDLVAEKGDEASSSQALSEENQAKLKEILSLLQRDVQDQVRDADLLREALEFIDQDLPADIKASLELVSQLDNHFAVVKQALKNQSSQPALEQRRAATKQSVKDLHAQI
jgi:hypothetical protein